MQTFWRQTGSNLLYAGIQSLVSHIDLVKLKFLWCLLMLPSYTVPKQIAIFWLFQADLSKKLNISYVPSTLENMISMESLS